MDSAKWIYRLNELGKEHNDIVGKKCANLGEMTRAEFPVPPGFALSFEAYEKFMKETGARKEIQQFLTTFKADPFQPADLPTYEGASQVIRGIVESKPMPKEIAEVISAYYEEVCQKTGINDAHVATRSAGAKSHPGQYESILHVSGISEVIQNIINVWGSSFNARSMINRARDGYPLDYDPIGVAVLHMVNATAAGVMFTLNPMDGDTSKIVIEGNWGLGESVVSGEITPDKWTVDKVVFEITETRISPKLKQYNMDPETDRPAFVDIPPNKQNVPCLNKKEIIALCKLGKALENHWGLPQDIEWAIDKDLPFSQSIFLVQCRPEQVWGGKKEASKLKLGTGSFGSLVSSFMKKSASILNGKKVLVVDDEKAILDSLTELLSMCRVETASSFEKAKELLVSKTYDVAVLDIMGVRGYELLEIANNRNIPALMHTAHALSEDHLKQSMRKGAAYYVPKDEMSKIEVFIADVLDARQKKVSPWERWLDRLGEFFNEKFGVSDWRDKCGSGKRRKLDSR